ncbi:MAG: hypothetical protein ABIO37_06940 [Caulobacteraceae bacterium]
MAKRSVTRWLLPAGALAGVVTLAVGFWPIPGTPAPNEPNVCWRMDRGPAKPTFVRLGRRVDNLESCAARLEGLHLKDRREVVGAYQGRFIIVNLQNISSAQRLDGPRWRIFFDPQRAEIDRLLGMGAHNVDIHMSQAGP